MFEFFVAFKYLIPRKNSLSTSIIALMSVFVISLVVWLVLVFLSVTTGIEKNWLQKLTSLNAPLRISPSDAYYSSYYYQIDGVSQETNYCYKTLGEKLQTKTTNPYSPTKDMELSFHFPKPINDAQGKPLDIVKKTANLLENEKKQFPDLSFQDYEVSAALLKISLSQEEKEEEKNSSLSQMSYLASINDKNPLFSSLLLLPSSQDLHHILSSLERSSQARDILRKKFHLFFDSLSITKLKTSPNWQLPLSLLSKNKKIPIYLSSEKDHGFVLTNEHPTQSYANFLKGDLFFKDQKPFFISEGTTIALADSIKIYLDSPIVFETVFIPSSIDTATQVKDLVFSIKKTFFSHFFLEGNLSFDNLLIEQTSFSPPKNNESLWSYGWNENNHPHLVLGKKDKNVFPVLLPKSFQDSHVLIGDRGTLSFTVATAISTEEQQIPIYISGFYDPGILPIGNRCILVPSAITQMIHASTSTFSTDGMPTNGFYLWFDGFSKADFFKQQIESSLKKEGLFPFWNVSTFKDYEFSKDLLQQFQSDRTLFTMIAILILLVACSNIISLLILLVNDKKKEIAVLQSMGASSKNIATIFGICGITMGLFSTLIGTLAAIFTLHHLDLVVQFLSMIQGHDAFNTAFFGKTLPNHFSFDALLFILIATPLLSLAAGIIPAIKASLLRPSAILRSE